MSDRLRPLWDFDDLEATEKRFRGQLEREETDAGRAEVLTQLARVQGLRDEFDAGDRLLDEATPLATSVAARVRVALERGRLRRSGGDPAAALPLFEEAFAVAGAGREDYLAGDAAHMAALAAPDPEARQEWTRRGIELANTSPAASYWLGPLLNNIGWEHFDAQEYEHALEAFQGALEARLRTPEQREAVQHARDAVAAALRALGRADEADAFSAGDR